MSFVALPGPTNGAFALPKPLTCDQGSGRNKGRERKGKEKKGGNGGRQGREKREGKLRTHRIFQKSAPMN